MEYITLRTDHLFDQIDEALALAREMAARLEELSEYEGAMIDTRVKVHQAISGADLLRNYYKGLIERQSDLPDLMERLAELEHDQWVAWSKAIAESETVSPERLERWRHLWIPYAELSEEQKEHDRKWAVLALRIMITGSRDEPKQ